MKDTLHPLSILNYFKNLYFCILSPKIVLTLLRRVPCSEGALSSLVRRTRIKPRRTKYQRELPFTSPSTFKLWENKYERLLTSSSSDQVSRLLISFHKSKQLSFEVWIYKKAAISYNIFVLFYMLKISIPDLRFALACSTSRWL